MADPDRLVREVRERYAGAALAVLDPSAHHSDALEPSARAADASAGCCGGPATTREAGDTTADAATDGACCATTPVFGADMYPATDTAAVPGAAVMASLGCGNPIAVAELRPGETVLDLGSGGGLDVLLSARRVGPTGHAYGLDMTPEMLQLARRNAAEAGVTNVEFLEGRIESIPLADATVDVVISNCVVNLSVDKPAVFREIARVLRPGGRIGITDVVADDALDPAQRAERGDFAGCIAGALSITEYREGLAAAGLREVVIEPTHTVADGMYDAIIRAMKPGR